MMKQYWFLLALLPFLAFVCKPSSSKCLEGKVVRISCASFVVQVLGQQRIGEYGWKNEKDGKMYDNVINITNSCKMGSWQKDDAIYFSIADSGKANDCVTCMMYDAPPKIALQVENVSKNPCR